MSAVGAIFVPFPPKTGTNMLHPPPAQFLNLSAVSVGVAVRDGSRVLALVLLVFVHHYNRARRLGNCVLPLEPPGTTAITVV